jgi:hypothetical protein
MTGIPNGPRFAQMQRALMSSHPAFEFTEDEMASALSEFSVTYDLHLMEYGYEVAEKMADEIAAFFSSAPPSALTDCGLHFSQASLDIKASCDKFVAAEPQSEHINNDTLTVTLAIVSESVT